LAAAGWLRRDIDHPGVPLDTDGLPTGEMKGPEAMTAVADVVGMDRTALAGDEDAVRRFGRLCVRKGVTTATDLASPLPEDAVRMMLRVTGEADYPARIVPLLRLLGQPVAQAIARAVELGGLSTDRLRLGSIKVVADGSIQGFSARLRAPGYFNGAPNGLWYTAPEQMTQAYELALAQGVQIHTHTNGDEATELALDVLESALARHPRPDHRFTLQHCQLADRAQFLRMKALGVAVNLFANHHFYWGDEHYRMTVGPERATRMNACRTALQTGVPLAIHSDAPVTPMGPLFTAWCAVNRLTASGRVQGDYECIGVDDALRAVTLGAAYTLKLDSEVGSIETGKRADFAVLEQDPFEVAPSALRDVPVWGVVQGGRVFEAAAQ
jgi:predicted amidohydrolase YtcJ